MTKNATLGRPKDEAKAAKILAAAGTQFIKQGVSHTTMAAIAEQAGVSKYTVYNHYGSKEALFQSVIQHKCDGFMDKTAFSNLPVDDAKEGLEAIGLGFVGILFDQEVLAMHRTIMAESRHDKTIAKLFYAAGPKYVSDLLDAYLTQLHDHGELCVEDVARATEVFLSLFTGKTHMQVVLNLAPKPTKKRLKQFVEENVDFFLRIFGR